MASSKRRTFAQRAMEADPIVRIYESRLWRRSLVVRGVLGLSFARESALILEAMQLGATRDVLDLACGSGIYTRPLARALPGGRVVGLDRSRPMLRHALRRAGAERLRNASFVRGDALRLPFSDARFDVVNCCGALHLFPDAACAVAEVHRVLRRGGRFTVAVVRRDEGLLAPLAGVLARLGVESFTPATLTALLGGAGFESVQIHHARALWVIASATKPRV
jgi:SAM-dependent methyltransferase